MNLRVWAPVGAAVAVGAILATAAVAHPAHALVGSTDAARVYDGNAYVTRRQPDGRVTGCGGALITPQWVLVAGQCLSVITAFPDVVALDPESVSVRVGSTDRTQGGVTTVGTAVFLHPAWSWGTEPGRVADLGLIRLAVPLSAPTMRRYTTGRVPAGTVVRLLGWGLTTDPTPEGEVTYPTQLRQLDTTTQPAARCADGGISEGELCVGTPGHGGCYGDAGSPALVGDNPPMLVGLGSRSAEPTCGVGIYTDLTDPTYQQWITQTLRANPAPCTHCPTPTPATRGGAGIAPLHRSAATVQTRVPRYWF